MAPAIPDGARIHIRAGTEERCGVGDVIAFVGGSRVIAHRIVYEGRRGAARRFLVAQGDGNWLCDPPVNRSTVVGIVEGFSVGGDRRPVGPATPMPLLRRRVALTSQRMIIAALERDPLRAIRIARRMSLARLLLRRLVSKVNTLRPGYVRH